MRCYMINVNAYGIMTLLLGRAGENNVTRIEFDYTPWAEEFGDGTLSLLHEREGDSEPYPVIITVENNIGTWLVSNVDTSVTGVGRAQLIYIVDDQIKKSRVYNTNVAPSLKESSEVPPDPYESWLEQMLEAATSVSDTKADIEQLAQEIDDQADEISAKVDEITGLIITGKSEIATTINTGQTEIATAITTGKSEINTTVTNGKAEINTAISTGETEITALVTSGKSELTDIINSIQATDVNNDGNIVITL